MDFQQQSYTIDQLVSRIKSARLALPDFQRDFVWSPNRVVELLDSVSKQWPIGSLLLLIGPQPFAIKSIESGPLINDGELDLYVLDGQQRLTSLFHAVADTSEYCYFVDFEALIRGDDDYLSWEKRKSFEIKNPDLQSRANNLLALISDVWDTQNFYRWLECLPSQELKNTCVELRELRIPGLHSKVYKVMAIVLDQQIELEALARIFETLNRTGVALTAFDLLVATLYPTGFKLRDKWEQALEEHEILETISPNELEVIKLISLVARGIFGKKESKGVKQGDLLRLNKNKIQELWPECCDLYAKSLQYCANNFGVTSQDLMPSWGMVLGIASWLKFRPDDEYAIKYWWFDRLYTQIFSQASNTRIISEFDALLNHSIDSDVWQTNHPYASTDLPAKSNGVLMRGIGSLLVKNGARDLLSDKPISEFKKVAFRSIQPNGEITRPKGLDKINSIIVVSEETDKKLGKSRNINNLPEVAMKNIVKQGISLDSFIRDDLFIENVKKNVFDRGDK